MKSISVLIIAITIVTRLTAWDTFSIGYGANQFQSATFMNNNILYGLDFIHISTKLTNETSESFYDYYGNYMGEEYQKSENGISVNVFMPRLGYRSPLGSKDKINTYWQVQGYLIIPFVSLDFEGAATGDIESDIEDAIDLLGAKGSYIVEYMFNDQFSLSADVGLNWIIHNLKIDNSGAESEIKTMIGTSYTQIALNFKM